MNVLKWSVIKRRLLDVGYRIVCTVFHYVCALVYGFTARKAPPISNPILQMSATELARLIREGQLRSESVIQAYINRILEVEPFINATVDRRFGEALNEAKQADALIASGTVTRMRLEKEKPLLGVPFSVKILIKVKGLRCTAGCYLFKDLTAHEDAVSVSLMKQAGAIVLVTTNIPELGLSLQTSNNVHGTTCNPYDTSRTSGGSSGGESALIAAAGSVIGLGNDLAGSIRIPSMLTGIFGHKPSRGLVSNEVLFPPISSQLNRLLSTGPMCRYAQDLVTMMKIISIPNESSARIGESVDFKDIKVYYMLSFGDDILLTEKVDSQVRDAVNKVVSYFETQKSSKVKQISIPLLKRSFVLFIHRVISAIPRMEETLTAGTAKVHGLRELLKFLCRQSKFTLGYIMSLNSRTIPLLYNPDSEDSYKKLENEIDSQINNILDDKSILVLPTLPFPAPYHNEIHLYTSSACYTCMFNILGMPSSQCPVGFTPQGLPVGVQIVSRRGNDNLTLAAALEMEKAFGGWKPPQ